MKKIIGGRKYDTETAAVMGNDYFSNISDFNYWEETLYRKRTGEFFLHGKGGPRSRYSVQVGLRGWTSGEKIIPFTEEEAKSWAEEHLTGDEYEKIFGEIQE